MERANYLPGQRLHALDLACSLINASLPGFGCFLVGSSLARRDWRDVDVRFIMSDEDYDRTFSGASGEREDGLWSILCVSVSAWLSQQSGLPVDFQVQRQTQANARHPGPRSALGISPTYPGEPPSRV